MHNLPAWGWMWVIAFSLYVGSKLLTLKPLAHPFAIPGIWIYLLAWPGMNSPDFFQRTNRTSEKTIHGVGIAFMFAGLLILGVAGAQPNPTFQGILGMIGVVSFLHFGLFRILSDWWNRMGWNAPALMQAPLLATSLTDFWGRRWNRAFRDLTHAYLFRPLVKHLNSYKALMCGFLLSGLIHELVITLPAGGGYGGPTAYFLFQGLGLLGERRLWKNRALRMKQLMAWTILLFPLPLLFPPVFVREVMAPFVNALTPTL